MGSCISTQAVRTRKRSRSPNHKPSTPRGRGHEVARRSSVAARRSSVTARPLNVVSGPSPGNIFDKYQFGKELGRGEFGVTHRIVDVESGEAFACKTIAKTKLRTEIDVQDVRREVQIMRHLPQHPNIVAFKEAYEDKDAVYLVMELCEGGELFDRIVAKGHYTERAAANVVKTILEVCKVRHTLSILLFFFFNFYLQIHEDFKYLSLSYLLMSPDKLQTNVTYMVSIAVIESLKTLILRLKSRSWTIFLNLLPLCFVFECLFVLEIEMKMTPHAWLCFLLLSFCFCLFVCCVAWIAFVRNVKMQQHAPYGL